MWGLPLFAEKRSNFSNRPHETASSCQGQKNALIREHVSQIFIKRQAWQEQINRQRGCSEADANELLGRPFLPSLPLMEKGAGGSDENDCQRNRVKRSRIMGQRGVNHAAQGTYKTVIYRFGLRRTVVTQATRAPANIPMTALAPSNAKGSDRPVVEATTPTSATAKMPPPSTIDSFSAVTVLINFSFRFRLDE